MNLNNKFLMLDDGRYVNYSLISYIEVRQDGKTWKIVARIHSDASLATGWDELDVITDFETKRSAINHLRFNMG